MLIFRSYITEKEAQTENPYMHFLCDKNTGYFNSVTYMTGLTDSEMYHLTERYLSLNLNCRMEITKVYASVHSNECVSLVGRIGPVKPDTSFKVGAKVRLISKSGSEFYRDTPFTVVTHYADPKYLAIRVGSAGSNLLELFITDDGKVPGVGYIERIQDDE